MSTTPQLSYTTTDSDKHRPLAISIALASYLLLVATPAAGTLTKTGNLLTDPGFNSGSLPLLPFANTNQDRWLAEHAALVVGPDGGVGPHQGDGLLRIEEDGGATSQVRQVVDVSAYASDIDASRVTAEFYAEFDSCGNGSNDPEEVCAVATGPASSSGIANIRAFGSGTVGVDAVQLGFLSTGSTPIDDQPGTWDKLAVGELLSFQLPPLTRQIQVQAAYTSGTIPLNGYVDSAFLEMTIDNIQVVVPALSGGGMAILILALLLGARQLLHSVRRAA